MENLTKIDIIGNDIFCYNELTNERIHYEKDSDMDMFFNTFSTDQEMLTINLIYPVKRLLKFYKINESVPERFEEFLFEEMTQEEKNVFDAFVEMIKAK